MKQLRLYQVRSTFFGDEKFCFHATDDNDAKMKLHYWCNHHGFDTDTRRDFSVKEVQEPKYAGNVHNEWVSK